MATTASSILVIDDEVGMREGCRRALTLHGFHVRAAEHGAQGLRLLREESFDLVLLDAMMPGMSGLELLERIHEHDPDIICVMITGYATVDLASQAMKQGAQGFLPKPFTSDELLATVQEGLAEQQRRRDQRRQQELEEEARNLERIRQEMATLDAIESRFMLVLVHELRNPAGVIKSYLKLMRLGYVDDDEVDEYLEKLDSRADQLLAMLDDLLELARLKDIPSQVKMRPVAAADVLEEVAQKLRPLAEAKGLALEVEFQARPTMQIQRSHLQSLWTHLISNAIQYTPHGRIVADLAVVGSEVRSTVADTGIGIPLDEVSQVFQEFYRSEAAKQELPYSTGLGLAIVNQIVKVYAGSVEVDSKSGGGSSVTIALPMGAPSPEMGA